MGKNVADKHLDGITNTQIDLDKAGGMVKGGGAVAAVAGTALIVGNLGRFGIGHEEAMLLVRLMSSPATIGGGIAMIAGMSKEEKAEGKLKELFEEAQGFYEQIKDGGSVLADQFIDRLTQLRNRSVEKQGLKKLALGDSKPQEQPREI